MRRGNRKPLETAAETGGKSQQKERSESLLLGTCPGCLSSTLLGAAGGGVGVCRGSAPHLRGGVQEAGAGAWKQSLIADTVQMGCRQGSRLQRRTNQKGSVPPVQLRAPEADWS